MAEQITIRRKVNNSNEELEKLRWFRTVGYLDYFNIQPRRYVLFELSWLAGKGA